MDKSEIKLSIIMPAYNAEKYISKSIRSILQQDFREFELIIINDGSTDQTRFICEEYQKQDSRIKLINSVNQGASASRNLGLSSASGNFITFVDADDWIDKEMYSILLSEFNDDIDIVICGIKKEYPVRRYSEHEVDSFESKTVEAKDSFERLFENGYLWNKIYRNQIIKEIRLDEPIKIEEDWIFNIKAFSKASKVKFVNQSFYHYLQNDTSVLHQKDCRSVIPTLQYISKAIKNCPVDENKLKESLIREYYSIVIYSTVWSLSQGNKDGASFFKNGQNELRKAKSLIILDHIFSFRTKMVAVVEMIFPYSFCRLLWNLKSKARTV